MSYGKRFFHLFVVLMVASLALSAVVGPVAADHQNEMPNPDADSTHNPRIPVNVTIAEYKADWGDDPHYEDNNGDVQALNAEVNDSYANQYEVTFSHIDTTAYTEFPINTGTEGTSTWTESDNWTTTSASGGSVSVSETTAATNVDSITVNATSQTASGDVVNASIDGYKVDSDIQQRFVQLVVNVDKIDGSTVTIRVRDTDGDYVAGEIDSGVNASMGNNISSTTGDGFVFQQQVGSMTVKGTGDGTMDTLNETRVVVEGGNATVELVGMNLERSSPWTLGTQMVDTADDDDSDKETEQTVEQVNKSGAVRLKSIDSMGSVFSSATLRDVTIPVTFYQGDYSQPSGYERYNASADKAEDFANFEWRMDDYRRFHLPSAYDLTYSNARLKGVAEVPSNRYQTVEYKTGVGEKNFSDISGWNDVTSNYDSLDKNVTLTNSVNAGEQIAVRYDYVITDGEHEAAFDMSDTGEADTTGGSGGGFFQGTDGGLMNTLVSPITGAIAAVLSFLGLKAKSG